MRHLADECAFEDEDRIVELTFTDVWPDMVVFVDSDVPCNVEGRRRVKSWLAALAKHHNRTLGDLSIVSFRRRAATYNRQYLDHDTYTDIITFDHTEGTTLR